LAVAPAASGVAVIAGIVGDAVERADGTLRSGGNSLGWAEDAAEKVEAFTPEYPPGEETGKPSPGCSCKKSGKLKKSVEPLRMEYVPATSVLI
jgi:hypothetical protein